MQVVPSAEDYELLHEYPILHSPLKQRRQLQASCFFRLPVFTSNLVSAHFRFTSNFNIHFEFLKPGFSINRIPCRISLISISISRSLESRSSFSMEEQLKMAKDKALKEDNEENEAIELVLFQVSECYVYLIPPRKSAASYRADEWDVNKWAWEGKLKVLSKGEECIIRLEDKNTGELYARAFLRDGEQHPVETVIDSSRYFVLRIEENIGGRLRHAFIGIGFRERTEAYDFQAALHDHMKYLNKKKSAEEMEQQFQNTSLVDYSLKEGETIVLQLKSKKSTSFNKSSELDVKVSSSDEEGKTKKESIFCIKPPPPPPAPLSPVAAQKSPTSLPSNINLEEPSKHKNSEPAKEDSNATECHSTLDVPDDDFGDFQTAG